MNVRDRIVEQRVARIREEGSALGVEVPDTRVSPLVPFLRPPGIICEIKRRSPSRGAIDQSLDPVTLADSYASKGVQSISVLTEEDHFAGSLNDLIAVKSAHPHLAVLRKDFLVDIDDVEISYRAGADAILLIAGILAADVLRLMHRRAHELGMAALVELHDPDDFEKARSTAPDLVGINARDLTSFSVDMLTPIRLRSTIDWPHRAVFESGAFYQEDGLLVSHAGFDGLLVGEAAVRDPAVIPRLIAGLRGTPVSSNAAAPPVPSFWSRVGERLNQADEGRPLVKVCGITNRMDAEAAATLGADLLGFIFADSPRRASLEVVRECADLDLLKVAVVVAGADPNTGELRGLSDDVRELLSSGLIDAVQFHGDESPEECARLAYPYYKVLSIKNPESADQLTHYRSPRCLVDARSPTSYGGTGKRVDADVVSAVRAIAPLWIAGGLNDNNIADVIEQFQPELIDAASGLESEPGKKDHDKLRRFLAAAYAAGKGHDKEI